MTDKTTTDETKADKTVQTDGGKDARGVQDTDKAAATAGPDTANVANEPATEPTTANKSDAKSDAAAKAPWNAFATPLIGKGVRWASRLLHHGGSAFPGRVAEIIDPTFLRRTLGRLPLGVVLVSGTNGKTTTTRMVASMLADLGLKVFTNPTGSNFTRGVVSALLEQVMLGGRLDADIAVLELDEAYAVHFVRQVRPRYALLLNVMRDQLDRFGEIDNTARLLGNVAKATDGTVVLNREDPRIAALAALAPEGTGVRYFGLADDLRRLFPSDDDMATTVSVEGRKAPGSSGEARTSHSSGPTRPTGPTRPSVPSLPDADVTFTAFGDHRATFRMDGRERTTDVRLEGVYNLYNAAAALAVVRAVVDDASARMRASMASTDTTQSRLSGKARRRLAAFRERLTRFANSDADALVRAVAQVTPAFGRGEVIEAAGSPIELLLVKNPMGFRLSLASFPPEGADTMIVINDEYADGRDMSWLWDVDFTSLRGTGVAQVSGVRAWDMALRLAYDQVPVERTDTDIESALNLFVHENPGTPKHIYCTYTAMLKVRAALGRIADVADAGVGR